MRTRPLTPLARVLRLLLRLVLGAIVVAVLVVGGTAFRVWQVARVDDWTRADVAIVLGAAQFNGVPSDVLEARLNHTLKLYRQGVVSYIATTGGKKPGDNYTEGEAGKIWLVDHGVPADHVLEVGEGSDTLGSLRAAANVAKAQGLKTAVIVSDPWHSLRARTMAEDAGLAAWTSPTRSGPNVQTRETQWFYIKRETGALLYYRLMKSHVDAFDVPKLG
ncbi:YdcF family protein [Lentzea sp. NBRC 105346]|uniref:YdcF family protein n=1 Tax=Lentzea sp. NBRC 105346 TaxID=3032205 RepID=UPI002556C086|nr:YdcF family protein [Lentzea sp. NBRC 105346]